MTARGSSASFDCRSGAVARGSSRGSALGGAEAGAAAAAGVVDLIAAAGRVSVAGALDVGGALTCTNSDAGGPATVGAGLTANGRRNSVTRAHAAVAVSNPTTRRTRSGALAAKQSTTTIPIVMAGTGDAVFSGLVASLARPAGNIAGLFCGQNP